MHISALLFSANYCTMVRYKFLYTEYCPPCFASWDIDPITTRDGPSQHLSQPYFPPFSKGGLLLVRTHGVLKWFVLPADGYKSNPLLAKPSVLW